MGTTEQSQGSEIGLVDAANRFLALEEGTQAQASPSTNDSGPAEVEETEAAAIEADETASEEIDPEASASSSEDEAAETVADDEGSEESADPLDQLVTVKIDGKTQEVTLREAVEGYQRQSDYSRNMVKLREEAKAVEQERQAAEAERAQYGQLVEALHSQLSQLMPQEPDWQRLHAEDPINYPLIRDQWRDYKERLAATAAERERLASIAQQQEQARLRALVDQGRQFLVEKMPEWKDPEKWNAAREQLRQYGRTVGYSDEELAQAYDPRALIVLDKARRYDALMANRPKPQPANGPKPMRAGTPAAAPKQFSDVQKARSRLSKTGSVDDAARLFGLLDRG